jgi:hypothetical protein
MDITTLHKNADRVSSIFNALSIFVLIIGGLGALVVLIAGFATAGSSDAPFVAILGGLIGALVAGIYTAITWAGVQLAAVIAGYVKVRTSPGEHL